MKEVRKEIQVQKEKKEETQEKQINGNGKKSNKPFHRKLSKYTLFISKLPIEIVA